MVMSHDIRSLYRKASFDSQRSCENPVSMARPRYFATCHRSFGVKGWDIAAAREESDGAPISYLPVVARIAERLSASHLRSFPVMAVVIASPPCASRLPRGGRLFVTFCKAIISMIELVRYHQRLMIANCHRLNVMKLWRFPEILRLLRRRVRGAQLKAVRQGSSFPAAWGCGRKRRPRIEQERGLSERGPPWQWLLCPRRRTTKTSPRHVAGSC